MKPSLAAIAFLLIGAVQPGTAAPAWAQQTLTPQQQHIKDCNETSARRKLTGEARRTFMSDCLARDAASGSATTSQQERMRSCNARAGKLRLSGQERQNFMSGCLKG